MSLWLDGGDKAREVESVADSKRVMTKCRSEVWAILLIFLFFKINLFLLVATYFTILWWFLPYIDMNLPWVYMCPPSWSPLPPPSPSHPSGSSQCTSPEHPVSCIDPGLGSISHMIIYMFQCYSLKPSQPRLLPPNPKVCSLHLCLFCCLTYRVIVTIFLNSIYMH